jgi:diguanylate cyclase (GGDEF)-like protein/PAS domain S-box-containing protein
MYGWSAKEVVDESVGEVLRTDFPRPFGEIKEILLSEGHWEGELIHSRRDGTRITVASRWSLQRDENGKPLGWLQLSSDVTEQRWAQKALLQAEELERRSTELTLLSQLGSFLQACLAAEEAYRVIAQFCEKLFPAESGMICVLSPSHNVVEAVAVWGEYPGAEQVFAPDDCWALRNGHMHVVEDRESALVCQHVVRSQASFYLCVPMVAQGDALGVLHIRGKPGRHGPPDSVQDGAAPSRPQLALAVAEQIGLALANLKLRDRLRTQSVRDALTGLFNRRYMEESLEREVRRAARKQGTLGTILLDIDYFKQFNDTLGHEAGDHLLRELGNFLELHVRGDDIACRYGGEEFILILPDASLETSRQRAEQIREAAKHLSIQYRGQPLETVTLSVGVAIYPEHGMTAQELLRAADGALYQAKKQGRDRVVVWKSDLERG